MWTDGFSKDSVEIGSVGTQLNSAMIQRAIGRYVAETANASKQSARIQRDSAEIQRRFSEDFSGDSAEL